MPTVQAPQQQAPMEAANPAQPKSIVTQQPKSEPLPSTDNNMSLRGGGFSIGCHERCCGMNCSFYRGCC